MGIDDFVELQPFHSASNRTAVVILEKGRKTRFPKDYSLWYRKAKGKRVSEDSTFDEVREQATYRAYKAEPIVPEQTTSVWITGRPIAIKAIRRIVGKSKIQARKGITASLNAAHWIEIISKRPDGLLTVANVTERAKREVQQVTGSIESDLAYPLLRGRDVIRWKATPELNILVTHLPTMRLKAIPEKEMSIELPKTYGFLKQFEGILRESSVFKRYFKPNDPFYSMFNVGEYTFAPYKVVFREIASEFTCAVVGSIDGKPIVPDHKLILCPFQGEDEAHFYAALLNSSPVRLFVSMFAIETQMSSNIIEHLRLNEFDENNHTHVRLSKLSRTAHTLAAGSEETILEDLHSIESEIDDLAARVWGLTDGELKEIQRNLAELA